MPIKIVHFVSGLKSGGVEQVLYNYISKMDPNIYENYIVYQHEADPVCYTKMAEITKGLYNIPYKIKRPFANLKEARKVIKQIKPDIVHCHMSKVNFFGLLPAYKEKIKVRINHSHAAVPTSSFFKKCYYKICDRLNCKYATHLVGCGEEAAKFIYKSKKDKRNVSVLTNRIDDKKFAYSLEYRNNIRKLLNVKDDEKLLGTIGRLETQKNHLRLIEIFKSLCDVDDNYKLLIVGSGSLKNQICELLEKYEIKDKVIISNPVPDVYKYYSGMDCFILPSLYEGLPLVSVEAQFNEIPTILSDTVALSAKMTDDVTYISLEESNDIWVKNIVEKVNKGRFEKNTEKLYERFSLNVEKNDLSDLYEDMLGDAN